LLTVPEHLVDLHTHSVWSHDGGLSMEQIRHTLVTDQLGSIAVTDHDVIHPEVEDLAEEFGGRVIVGEEVTTLYRGRKIEIIGLFLEEEIEPGLDTRFVMDAIHDQGGLVYGPHPFDLPKKGFPKGDADRLHRAGHFDVVEGFNSRTLKSHRHYEEEIAKWAAVNGIILASGSDAHGIHGLNGTGNLIDTVPSRDNLLEQLDQRVAVNNPASLAARAHPKINKAKKLVTRIGLPAVQSIA
jgi:predicted metal-dependent phosphoesterase TrpH